MNEETNVFFMRKKICLKRILDGKEGSVVSANSVLTFWGNKILDFSGPSL